MKDTSLLPLVQCGPVLFPATTLLWSLIPFATFSHGAQNRSIFKLISSVFSVYSRSLATFPSSQVLCALTFPISMFPAVSSIFLFSLLCLLFSDLLCELYLEQSPICLAHTLHLGQRAPEDSTGFQSHIA